MHQREIALILDALPSQAPLEFIYLSPLPSCWKMFRSTAHWKIWNVLSWSVSWQDGSVCKYPFHPQKCWERITFADSKARMTAAKWEVQRSKECLLATWGSSSCYPKFKTDIQRWANRLSGSPLLFVHPTCVLFFGRPHL